MFGQTVVYNQAKRITVIVAEGKSSSASVLISSSVWPALVNVLAANIKEGKGEKKKAKWGHCSAVSVVFSSFIEITDWSHRDIIVF